MPPLPNVFPCPEDIFVGGGNRKLVLFVLGLDLVWGRVGTTCTQCAMSPYDLT
jgi:hypothetical protein